MSLMSPLQQVEPPATETRPLTVSELTAQVKGTLEDRFPSVWVTGEVSNLARPQSGHIYFTLKDERAQLRAVIWRAAAGRLPFELADGVALVCRGRLDVYPPRGAYQLIVELAQLEGMGSLELALRKLKDKLAKQGLFDPDRKRPLPAFPKRIAVVTSPTGAAIRDFLQVVRRRWRGVHVLVVPTRVQGKGSAQEIAAAIELAGRLLPAPDVIVVTRGGGSLEDLWAFNEEPVVQAIAAATIPIVSAVGHEIDVTLADLAADQRALTPTEAAERVVPSAADIEDALRGLAQRLVAALRGRAREARMRLQALASRPVLERPQDRVHELGRRLDELAARGGRAVREQERGARRRLETLAGKLDSLSPLGVLQRGYSITTTGADGKPVRRAEELAEGQQITTRFAAGRATSRIDSIGP